MYDLNCLLKIMKRLRDPQEGCEWDLSQTYETVLPHTIEEVYEVADAIERKDYHNLKGELGDLLFQIVFYSQLSTEYSIFDFADVVDGICQKMIRRHPHVFNSPMQQNHMIRESESWEEIKQRERAEECPEYDSVLDGVAPPVPSLSMAVKLQQRAASIVFDWTTIKPVVEKIEEELEELCVEVDNKSEATKIQEELGDLLFACVNLARHLNINPEIALRHANQKFERRFRQVEVLTNSTSPSNTNTPLELMQTYWERVKVNEKK